MELKGTFPAVSCWSHVLSEATKMNLQKDPDSDWGLEGTPENPVSAGEMDQSAGMRA